jgi:hypothetical protein
VSILRKMALNFSKNSRNDILLQNYTIYINIDSKTGHFKSYNCHDLLLFGLFSSFETQNH